MRTIDVNLMGYLAVSLAVGLCGCSGPDTNSSDEPECVTAAECPSPTWECVQATCISGACGIASAARGAPVAAQFVGDCRREQCDGNGAIESVPDDADVAPGGQKCAANSCKDGLQMTTNAPVGTPCGAASGLVCNGIGDCSAPTCGGTVGFPGLPVLETGRAPDAVVAADLNGDGIPDLAAANEVGGDVSVFLGLGKGRFAAAASYPSGGAPSAIAAADFDGLNGLDLAVTNGKDDSVSVLFNQGNGSFGAPVQYAVSYDPFAVAAADVNEDNKPDIVVSSNLSGTISVLHNQGDGSFAPAEVYDASLPGPIAVIDVDGDTKQDLVVGGYLYGFHSIEVLLNLGNGSFGPPSQYGEGRLTASIAVADLNGDGKPDLAVTHLLKGDQNVLEDYVGVFLNNGNGTFVDVADYPIDGVLTSIVAADFSQDGAIDLAVTSETSGRMFVLHNQGAGAFGAPIEHAVGAEPSSLAAADLDGDGKTDLSVANKASDNLHVLLNQGGGTFPSRSGVTTTVAGMNGHTTVLAVADLNGDGLPDLVAGAENIDGEEVIVLLSQGDGSFAELERHEAKYLNSIVAADLDGDGLPDLALGSGASGGLRVLRNKGAGSFEPWDQPFKATSLFVAAAKDLNADGKPDLLLLESGLSVVLNQGGGTFADPVPYELGGYAGAVAVADFNGDDSPDLAAVVWEYVDMTGFVRVFFNQGDGTFGGAADYSVGDPPGSIVAADLNGDGKTDLALSTLGELGDFDDPAICELRVLENQGDGTFKAGFGASLGIGYAWLTAADMSGDGTPDLVAANAEQSCVRVLENQGSGTFSSAGCYPASVYPTGVAAVELNGDGRVDLVVPSHTAPNVNFLFQTCVP
jgi:hypothetical protein